MQGEAARLLSLARSLDTPAEEMLDLCRRALEYAPNSVDVYRTAVEGMYLRRQLRSCSDLLRQALDRFPSDTVILEAYALWLEHNGNFDVAVPYWRRLNQLAPELDPYQLNVARALMYATQLDEAAHILQNALKDPENMTTVVLTQAHALYGETLLKAGNPDGFGHYIQRMWANAGFFNIPGLPWWQGEPLVGKRILITHHLGYGDQLLMASVIPILEACGASVAVTLDNAVASLVHHASPYTNIQIADRSCTPGQMPGPDILAYKEKIRPDFQATLLHLPIIARKLAGPDCALFRGAISAPEAAKQYVAPVVDRVVEVAHGRKIVALAWDCIQRHFAYQQGEYVASFSARRSIPTPQIANFVDDPAVSEQYHFVSLHPHTHFEKITDPLPQNLSLLGTTINCFTDTAAIIERCDSVLSIDMSMANLASLMNKETTLMLQHEGEWRFGVRGERSPWLSAPRCLRQNIPGEWAPVLSAVREHLLTKAMSFAHA